MSGRLVVVPHRVRDRRGPRRWALGAELLAAGLAATGQCPAGLGDVRLHVDPTGDRLVIDLRNGRESARFVADRWAADRFCWRVVVPEGRPEMLARQIDAAVTWCLGGVR